jgi:hypothetical protein
MHICLIDFKVISRYTPYPSFFVYTGGGGSTKADLLLGYYHAAVNAPSPASPASTTSAANILFEFAFSNNRNRATSSGKGDGEGYFDFF